MIDGWLCIVSEAITLKNPSIKERVEEAYSLAKKSKFIIKEIIVEIYTDFLINEIIGQFTAEWQFPTLIFTLTSEELFCESIVRKQTSL